jgi:hypothetical protein
MTFGVDIDHLVKVAFLRFLLFKVILLPHHFHTVFTGRSHYAQLRTQHENLLLWETQTETWHTEARKK